MYPHHPPYTAHARSRTHFTLPPHYIQYKQVEYSCLPSFSFRVKFVQKKAKLLPLFMRTVNSEPRSMAHEYVRII